MNFRNCVVATALIAASGISAYAHSGATGVVKERMEMMSNIASEMKFIGKMLKGSIAFDAEAAAIAAAAIADYAGQIPEVFPATSGGGLSEAAPAIWENWDEFVALSDETASRAATLAEAVESAADPMDVRPAFRTLGNACLSCHEDFREAG